MTELLTIGEAAERLRVSGRTVYRLIAERRLRPMKVRGSTFIAGAEIARYLASVVRPTRVA